MRLNNNSLSGLPEAIAKPRYNRDLIKAGIVHLGLGAFHRAHQAVYTENCLNRFGGDWKIIGVSLRTPDVRDRMQAQNELYTVVERGLATTKYQVIGAIEKVIYAPENTAAVLSAMSSQTCKIISLTITEKGYCHNVVSDALNTRHPDIKHDLQHLSAPCSAIGFIVAALSRRKEQNTCIPTIVCCDNLPRNGDHLRQLVIEFATIIDGELGQWIAGAVSFPNTIVDRIVPTPSLQTITDLHKEQGYTDNAVINTELFSQWIIEDRFTSGRPAWEEAGALLVKDVAPYEGAKLRLLNGCHSAIAYLGYLAGYKTVHHVMQQAEFKMFIHYLMHEEIRPTVCPPSSLDLDHYCQELFERFANPALNHRTYQIAMDGSQKLPQRLLSVVHDQIVSRDGKIDAVSLAIAGWVRYACGVDEKGEGYVVQDPLAETMSTLFEQHGLHAENLTHSFLSLEEIFGPSTPINQKDKDLLKVKVSYWLDQLISAGAAETVKRFICDKTLYHKPVD